MSNTILVDTSEIVVTVVDERIDVNVIESIAEVVLSDTGPQGAKGDKGDTGDAIGGADAPITYDHGTSHVGLDYDPATLAVGPDGLTVVGGSFSGNADTLDNHDSSYFLDISSGAQTKAGNLTLSGTGTMGVLDLNSTKLMSDLMTISSISAVVIDSFNSTMYRSAEYLVQLSQGLSYTTTKFLIVHNGTDIAVTEYGTVILGDPIDYLIDSSFAGQILHVSIQCPNLSLGSVDLKLSKMLFDI